VNPVQLGLRITCIAALVVGSLAMPAEATTDIAIDFDELVFGAPGSVLTVAEVAVDESLVGRECTLKVHAENQSSVHIGNDLIVSTGSSQAVIVGVEDTANGGFDQTYQMVVGSSIMVQIRIGQDGMSSLGFGLTFDCETPATEVTTPGTGGQVIGQTTTTTVPPTTVVPTTAPPTTAPATTAAPTTTSTTAAPAPTVAGAVTNGLPETPAAQPVVRAPAYTG
jgi:hypothetical protein